MNFNEVKEILKPLIGTYVYLYDYAAKANVWKMKIVDYVTTKYQVKSRRRDNPVYRIDKESFILENGFRLNISTHTKDDSVDYERYLLQEFVHYYQNHPLNAIYINGGTPVHTLFKCKYGKVEYNWNLYNPFGWYKYVSGYKPRSLRGSAIYKTKYKVPYSSTYALAELRCYQLFTKPERLGLKIKTVDNFNDVYCMELIRLFFNNLIGEYINLGTINESYMGYAHRRSKNGPTHKSIIKNMQLLIGVKIEEVDRFTSIQLIFRNDTYSSVWDTEFLLNEIYSLWLNKNKSILCNDGRKFPLIKTSKHKFRTWESYCKEHKEYLDKKNA